MHRVQKQGDAIVTRGELSAVIMLIGLFIAGWAVIIMMGAHR